MEKKVDVESVLTDLGMLRASLSIIHNMHYGGDLCNADLLFAANTITVDALARAVKNIDGIMETLKPLKAEG